MTNEKRELSLELGEGATWLHAGAPLSAPGVAKAYAHFDIQVARDLSPEQMRHCIAALKRALTEEDLA